MISLRKSIALDADSTEVLAAAVPAYLAILDNLQRFAPPFEGCFVGKFQQSVRKVAQDVEREFSPRVLQQSVLDIAKELKTIWDCGRETLIRWRDDYRSLVRVLAESAGSVEARDRRCGDLFQQFSFRMDQLAQSGDVNEIRSLLRVEVAHLKSSFDQVLLESKAVTDGMRATVQRAEARCERVEAIAFTDALTGLPNRRQAEAVMEARLKLRSVWCVMLFDVDRFKAVNDTHGHACGDAVLRSIAATLRDSVRSTGLVCRWAGDEFVAVLECDVLGALAIGERISAAWGRRPVEFAGKTADIDISASWGVCQYLLGEGLEKFIARADAEMYQNKSRRAPPPLRYQG